METTPIRYGRPPKRPEERRLCQNLSLPPPQKARLQAAAARRGVSVSEIVREWIDQHLPATGSHAGKE
jgi:hypothetical protein